MNTEIAGKTFFTYFFLFFDIFDNTFNVFSIIQMLYKANIERIFKNWDNFGKQEKASTKSI